LEAGCERIDVFFMIGLPGQTAASVMESVEYASELLRKFGPCLNPSMGPLAPFIDPGCAYHRQPEKFGYRIIHNSLEDYAQASLAPHWRELLGYETEWMTRQEIVDVTYEALLALNAVKAKNGLVSPKHASLNDRRIRSTISLLKMVDDILNLEDPRLQLVELDKLHKEAVSLSKQLHLPKEELAWPVTGGRFRRLNMLRLMMGRV
jgi:radical SAM superfamily enzyme YgiQ (UPF0313 family)